MSKHGDLSAATWLARELSWSGRIGPRQQCPYCGHERLTVGVTRAECDGPGCGARVVPLLASEAREVERLLAALSQELEAALTPDTVPWHHLVHTRWIDEDVLRTARIGIVPPRDRVVERLAPWFSAARPPDAVGAVASDLVSQLESRAGWLAYVYTDRGGHPCSLRLRAVASRSFVTVVPRTRVGLFGLAPADSPEQRLVVVEGEHDLLALRSLYHRAGRRPPWAGALGGLHPIEPAWLVGLRPPPLLVFDNDSPGRRAAARARAEHGLEAIVSLRKDLDAMVRAGVSIEVVDRWLRFPTATDG